MPLSPGGNQCNLVSFHFSVQCYPLTYSLAYRCAEPCIPLSFIVAHLFDQLAFLTISLFDSALISAVHLPSFPSSMCFPPACTSRLFLVLPFSLVIAVPA